MKKSGAIAVLYSMRFNKIQIKSRPLPLILWLITSWQLLVERVTSELAISDNPIRVLLWIRRIQIGEIHRRCHRVNYGCMGFDGCGNTILFNPAANAKHHGNGWSRRMHFDFLANKHACHEGPSMLFLLWRKAYLMVVCIKQQNVWYLFIAKTSGQHLVPLLRHTGFPYLI